MEDAKLQGVKNPGHLKDIFKNTDQKARQDMHTIYDMHTNKHKQK